MANGEGVVLYPDSYDLSESNGRPSYSIKENDSGIVAKLRFQASFIASENLLFSRYGDEYYDLDIYKVDTLVTNVAFSTPFIADSNPHSLVETYKSSRIELVLHLHLIKTILLNRFAKLYFFLSPLPRLMLKLSAQ